MQRFSHNGAKVILREREVWPLAQPLESGSLRPHERENWLRQNGAKDPFDHLSIRIRPYPLDAITMGHRGDDHDLDRDLVGAEPPAAMPLYLRDESRPVIRATTH